ncbi:MAG: hypothetical protein EHM20_00315 [Alphaproteobacteria bacterium]|nr:MAG: hypothetical protein EHM20_00315 [Alphaproteobacteria bacterium]
MNKYLIPATMCIVFLLATMYALHEKEKPVIEGNGIKIDPVLYDEINKLIDDKNYEGAQVCNINTGKCIMIHKLED